MSGLHQQHHCLDADLVCPHDDCSACRIHGDCACRPCDVASRQPLLPHPAPPVHNSHCNGASNGILQRMDNNNDGPLLITEQQDHHHHKDLYRTTWLRWYVLFIFSFSSFAQCLVWFTFSSVPKEVRDYYKISNAQIDLLLNWGAIIFIPVLPYVSWLQTRPNGLLIAFWEGCILVFAASVIRTVPCWVPSDMRSNSYLLWTLHIGQMLNAAAGPIVLAVCSKLSVVWFPDNQRATATAIAYTVNSLGVTVGFLLGPAVVSKADDMPWLLYLEIGVATLPIIGGLIYYRERPPYPPSAAAVAHLEGKYESNFIYGIKDAVKNISFLLVVMAGGIQAGITSGWQGVLPQALNELHYSESQSGWLGFGNSLAGIIGGVVVGPILDLFFRRRFKLLLILLLLGACSAFSWFTLSLPTPFTKSALIPSNFWVLMAAISLGGLFQGAVGPVCYELSAELLYPVPEATSGGLLVLIFNAATLILLFVSPEISANWMNTIQTGAMMFCLLLIIFVWERYRRSDEEQIITKEKERKEAEREATNFSINHRDNDDDDDDTP